MSGKRPITGPVVRQMHRIYYGHDDGVGLADGVDVLVHVWPDGSVEVALRPGWQRRGTSWGPPVPLTDVTGDE